METGRSYRRIFQEVPYGELIGTYHPLHEAAEEKFIDALEHRLTASKQVTRLRALRDAAGLSQAELARRAGVGLRSIQMYEQRNKDIDKAQAVAILRLSRALHCDPEALLEAG